MKHSPATPKGLSRYASFRVSPADMEKIARKARAIGTTNCELARAILGVNARTVSRPPESTGVVITELALLGRGINQMNRAKNNAYYAAEALTKLSCRPRFRYAIFAEMYNEAAGAFILMENELWRLYRLYCWFSPPCRPELELLFETAGREPIPILSTPPHTA